MLIVSDFVRDVMCNEIIETSNAIKAGVMSDAMSHIKNMSDIIMSGKDFIHVDIDAWHSDIEDIAREIVERKRNNGK